MGERRPCEGRVNDTHRSCEGKTRFDSMPRARKVAARLSARHDSRAQAYRCRFCRGFHVGTNDGKRSDDRRNRREEIEA